ncbi:MAG: cation transporter [Paludibacteraceae bacterium]|nr:cation transporter [Paludibacteraceae bacterium]
MKQWLLILLALTLSIGTVNAKVNKQTVVLNVDLHCQGCCDKVMKNIAFEKGVKDIVCDLDTKTVTVTFDADKTNTEALLKAFDKIGKPATVKQQS